MERVNRDMAAGDLGMARTRLQSALQTRGYDPLLLTELGRVCHAMGDIFHAGRYWLLSTHAGPDVDHAIQQFLSRYGSDVKQAASQLPPSARLCKSEDYPPEVFERLMKLKMVDAVLRGEAVEQEAYRMSFSERAGCLAGVLIFALAVISMCAGAPTVVRFFWSVVRGVWSG